MEQQTIGVGIIGCGGRVRHVLQQVRKVSKAVKIVALFDPSPASIEATREKLNPRAKVYDDYEALVADPAVDWVFIGSWNTFHTAQAIAALRAGKHVFCEKPLATNFKDCLALTAARMRRPDLMFCVGFTLRFSPHYRKLKEVLEGGALGDVISMEFNEVLHFDHGGYIHADWRRLTKNAGSHLLEKCCHDMDLLLWFLGQRPSRVASFGGCDFFVARNKHHMARVGVGPTGRLAYTPWFPEDQKPNPFTIRKDVVDNQVALLEFPTGTRAMFHTNCNSNMPERRMFICGTEGTLRADVITGKIELCRIGYGEKIQRLDTGAKGGHGGGDAVLARELVDAMFRGIEPISKFEHGIEAALTCFGIDQALEKGRVQGMDSFWKQFDAKRKGKR